MAAPKTALITGGNKGIGFELACDLAHHGYRVLITTRSEEKGKQAVATAEQRGQALEFVLANVTDKASVVAAAVAVQGLVGDPAEGGLDILINNAGVRGDEFPGGPGNRARNVMDTNYYGLVNTFTSFIPLVKEGGLVVNVASVLGRAALGRVSKEMKTMVRTSAFDEADIVILVEDFVRSAGNREVETGGTAIYDMSKLAVLMISDVHQKRIDAGEMNAQKGIDMVCVCPGWCKTDLGGWEAYKSAAAGAKEIVHAVLSTPRKNLHGKFISSGHLSEWKM